MASVCTHCNRAFTHKPIRTGNDGRWHYCSAACRDRDYSSAPCPDDCPCPPFVRAVKERNRRCACGRLPETASGFQCADCRRTADDFRAQGTLAVLFPVTRGG